jgi:hypothetical protein
MQNYIEPQVSAPAVDLAKLRAATATMQAEMDRRYEELAPKREQHRRASLLAEAHPDMATTRDRLKTEIDGILSRINDLSAALSYGRDCIKDAELRALDARKAADWREVDQLINERFQAAEELLQTARKLGQQHARLTELADRIWRLAIPHLPPGQYDRARLSNADVDDLLRWEIQRCGGSFVAPNNNTVTEGRFGTVADYVAVQHLKLIEVSPLKGAG